MMEQAARLKRNTTKTDLSTSSSEEIMVRRVCLNTAGKGIAKTVLSGYYKYGVQTLLTGDFGTSGTIVLEISLEKSTLPKTE